MARGTALITNFTAGELSPRLDVRTDIDKYKNGARYLRNAIAVPHGGATKRPGSMHVLPCRDSTFASRLIDFEYSTTQAYVIEFAPGYLRFFKDQAVITNTALVITGATAANPCVITYTGTDPANGDQVLITSVGGMTELNNRVFTVANVNGGANTFELSGVDSSAYTAYTSGGSAAQPVQLAHTYSNTEIDELWVTQSADTMYIFHNAHPIRKLTRASHTSWTLTDTDITAGPFRDINSDDTHYLSVAVLGSASISGITRANPAVVTTSSAHDFEEGCTVTITGVVGMTNVNGVTYVCRNVTSTTFELWTQAAIKVDSSAYFAYTSGGTATVAQTGYVTVSPGSKVTLTSSKPLFNSGHVGALFRLWEPGKAGGMGIITAGAGVSQYDPYTHDGKVYGVGNTTAGSWSTSWGSPTHESGVVRIYNMQGSSYHDSVYLHDSSCVLKVLSYSSATSVVARVVKNHVPKSIIDTSVTSGTAIWEEGAWSAYRGYPRVGTFHKSRLFAASSASDPQHLWGSVIRGFENFQDGTEDDEAIVDQMLSDKVEIARWCVSGETLLIGTAGGIQSVSATSGGEGRGLTPSNVEITPQLPLGATKMIPIAIKDFLLYGERNGAVSNPARVVNEMVFDATKDKYVAPSVTIISEHITGEGVEEGAYQATPHSVCWFRRTDGQMAALTHESEQTVRAWHLHSMGGSTSDYSWGEVERLTVIPGPDGDEMWMVVKRQLASGTVRYIEYLTTGLLDTMDKEDAVYLDSTLTYSGASTSTITGLSHLEGQTVYALVDGAKQGPFTVTAGKITLSTAGVLAHVGLNYLSVVESVDLDEAAKAGTAKTRAKRISEVWLSMYRSLGGRVGPATSRMYDLQYRTDDDLMGSSPALKTDFIRVGFPGGWKKRAYIRFEHDEPYPFTLLGIAAEISTSG